MTEASVPVSRLLVFAALCVGLGPAIGAFVAILQSEMFGPHIGHPLALIFNIRLIGPILLVGYMIGAPVALIAAISSPSWYIGATRMGWAPPILRPLLQPPFCS